MPDRGVILSLTERLPKFSMSCGALTIFSFAERLPKFSMREDNSVSNDVFVRFENKPTKEEILEAWKNYKGKPQLLDLPSAPEQFITYFEEDNRPQAALDRDIYGGMGVTLGRLREDSYFDYKFVGLSHNTLRGAAGGAVLMAELLAAKGYFD